MSIHRADSQTTIILNHLLSGEEINPLQSLNMYGVYRLGAVIFKLKREGHCISSRLEKYENKNGKKRHYAVYKLEE